MRAARRILAEEDPNPNSHAHLHASLVERKRPIPTIQPVNDTVRLQRLRKTLGSFNEKARVGRLARDARLMVPDRKVQFNSDVMDLVRVRVVRPRAQLLGEGTTAQSAYRYFTVLCSAHAKGETLKKIISEKQSALGLRTLPNQHCRLFLHELAGRGYSPFVGREIVDLRSLGEYGIVPEGYDVTIWQNQSMVEPQAAATVLYVDGRPGVLLSEQAEFVDECRAKEVPCYTQMS